MLKHFLLQKINRFNRFCLAWGASPNETPETAQKRSMGLTLLPVGILAEIQLGILCFAFGETLAGQIEFLAVSLLFLSIFLLGITRKNYYFYSFTWLLHLLLIGPIIGALLGQFFNSGFVQIWTLFTPVLALLIHRPQYLIYWCFFSFLCLISSGISQPFLPVSNHFPVAIKITLFGFNVVASSFIFILPTWFFFKQSDTAIKMLKEEQHKSENLLLNILPREITAILKNENRVIADHFDETSILFADIVDFTQLSSMLSPTETVEMLNEVFSQFDLLAEKHNLEKIKTIGDCYMVASGVPLHRLDHAIAITQMALEMQELAQNRTFGGHQLMFRIGINSGPVVAGVIGRKKFIYDLWGDAVNIASRMESLGKGGSIQVTEVTYNLIKAQFLCEPYGCIEVKGKGEMKVWHVGQQIQPQNLPV